MACKNVCRLCNHLIISTAVAVSGTNLVVTIPDGSYYNDEKYCIVIAQTIPAAATVNMPVVIQIGTGTQLYPLINCDCVQLTACQLHTRTKYATRVLTNSTGGTFRILGNVCGCCINQLSSINGTAPATVTTEAVVTAAKKNG